MRYWCFTLLFFTLLANAQGGGVYLGATRVVFSSSAKTAALRVGNTSATDVWLVRSWVSGGDESAGAEPLKVPFIITPPLYRLDPQSSLHLKINALPNTLPQDRESLFYVNVMAIPPNQSVEEGGESVGGVMKFTFNNRIKLFYRPAGLADKAGSAYEQVRVEPSAEGFSFHNPTPYHITLTQLTIDGVAHDKAGLMLAPFGHGSIPYQGPMKSLSFKSINDFGGFSSVVSKLF